MKGCECHAGFAGWPMRTEVKKEIRVKDFKGLLEKIEKLRK
ncbi:MAG: hypothetical protein ABIB71_00545 [Candidatus Woesearchaeota archaeon]